MAEEPKDSRREVLKKMGKTAAFVIPVMTSFNINTLAMPASGAGKITVKAEFPD